LRTFRIIVASRSGATADTLADRLIKHPQFQVTTRVIANGHADPLHGVSELPDLLFLHYGSGQSELLFLAEHGMRDQVPLLVCGPANNPEAMRLAMQAGARDYLPEDVSEEDLVASLARIQQEALRAQTAGSGKLIVFANGKGGSGASFLATNLAHSLVVDGGHRVTLVDLDLQFGGLCRYLDISPKVGILEALDAAHELDDVSAQAYTNEHSSGLRLLAAPCMRLALANEISLERLDALLDFYLASNDYVVADSPSRLDSLTEFFLERADRIILVVQQSLPHVYDAARLLHLLTSEINVPKERIGVVVNRFSKSAAVELGDIKKALRQDKLFTIPNQYKLASESINSGIPVADISKSAALTKSIRKLRVALSDPESSPSRNIFQRALPTFLKARMS